MRKKRRNQLQVSGATSLRLRRRLICSEKNVKKMMTKIGRKVGEKNKSGVTEESLIESIRKSNIDFS